MPDTPSSSAQNPSGSAEALLDDILRRQARIFAQEYAALRHGSDDPEHPHKARVALRRLRAALSGFGPILDDRAARRLSRRARALFRMLGPLRDADVAARSFAKGDARQEMQARADRIRDETRKNLAAARADELESVVERALEARSLIASRHGPLRLARADASLLGAQALQIAWTAARAYGPHLSDWDDFTRHEFRKDIKTLRYITEFFGEIWTGQARGTFLARLTRLQDALGELNDIAVHFSDREPDAKIRRRFDKAMTAADTHWEVLRKLGAWWGARPTG